MCWPDIHRGSPPSPLVMSPGELERLLPLAIDDLKATLAHSFWPYPSDNPAKVDEWEARNRRRFEAVLFRVNQLYAAWLNNRLEALRP